jgi:hypothetical protein
VAYLEAGTFASFQVTKTNPDGSYVISWTDLQAWKQLFLEARLGHPSVFFDPIRRTQLSLSPPLLPAINVQSTRNVTEGVEIKDLCLHVEPTTMLDTLGAKLFSDYIAGIRFRRCELGDFEKGGCNQVFRVGKADKRCCKWEHSRKLSRIRAKKKS